MDKDLKNKLMLIAFVLLLMSLVIIQFAIIIPKTPINIEERFINLLFGIGGGLFSFTITFFLTQKYFHLAGNKIDDIKKSFLPHEIDSKTILNTVQGKSISLVAMDRKELEGKGYYENNYFKANDIRISSISLTPLIKYLCNPNPGRDHLISQLKKRKYVTVKIILMSPDSPIVKILDNQEKNNQILVSKKIKNTIDLLKDFAKINNGSLAEGSRISVAITSQTMNFTISYAGNTKKDQNDTLLIGFLFGYKVGGPLYKVPFVQEINMYNDCLDYFDDLYKESDKIIFDWAERKNFY